MKTKVVHSQSKNAWNVVGEELGGKYKIARIPYEQCGDDILNTRWKYEALEIAMHISKSMKTFNTKEKQSVDFEIESQPTLHWDSLPTPNEINKRMKKNENNK